MVTPRSRLGSWLAAGVTAFSEAQARRGAFAAGLSGPADCSDSRGAVGRKMDGLREMPGMDKEETAGFPANAAQETPAVSSSLRAIQRNQIGSLSRRWDRSAAWVVFPRAPGPEAVTV